MEGWQVAGQIGMPGEAQQKKTHRNNGIMVIYGDLMVILWE